MNPREPRPRQVSLKELAELCGDDADALYYLSARYPDSIESASKSLQIWNQVLRPWLVEFEDEYRKGDEEAAFRALLMASGFDHFPVPRWAVQAIYRGWDAYINWEPDADSVNAGMGFKRERKRQKEHRRRVLLKDLAKRLIKYHSQARNRDINKTLYADVAKELLDPSTIPQSWIRQQVELTMERLREECGEPLTELSGTTVGRWYEEAKIIDATLYEKMKQRSLSAEEDTTAKTGKGAPHHHFIFDKSKT